MSNIPEGKKRIAITLELELIDKLQQLAKENRRKVSDEVALMIKKAVDKNDE